MATHRNVIHEVIDIFGGRVEPVAAAVGVSGQTIRNWRDAGSLADAKGVHLVRLAEALLERGHPMSLRRLINGDGSPTPEPPIRTKGMKSRWLMDSRPVPEQGTTDPGSSPAARLALPVTEPAVLKAA